MGTKKGNAVLASISERFGLSWATAWDATQKGLSTLATQHAIRTGIRNQALLRERVKTLPPALEGR